MNDIYPLKILDIFIVDVNIFCSPIYVQFNKPTLDNVQNISKI